MLLQFKARQEKNATLSKIDQENIVPNPCPEKNFTISNLVIKIIPLSPTYIRELISRMCMSAS